MLLEILLLLLPVAFGQSAAIDIAEPADDGTLLTRPIPRPYLSSGILLLGGGYVPFAISGEVGLDLESTHWMAWTQGSYDNGHKAAEFGVPAPGDVARLEPNPKGHDRELEGAMYYRPLEVWPGGWPRGWFVGPGFHWSELSTTDFTKRSNGPEIGGGYDFIRQYCTFCPLDGSIRVQLDWQMAGNNWQNGVHGPAITGTFPSPLAIKTHFFAREKLAFYRYYTTVTEPDNVALTILQRNHRSVFVDCAFSVGYRF